jgi:hypothetical protein
LKLFEDRPDELKFVVGHELGHVKCQHIELKRKSHGLLGVIQAIDATVVPDKFQDFLPTLALGRVLTWCRESEISADRAGLLCCGEPQIAYQAMNRLLHGLAPDSPWIDPDKDFDWEKVLRNFKTWQNEPFVKFILEIKRQQLEHPFVPERLAALKQWADTGAYRKILERDPRKDYSRLIEVVKIQAYELAPEGESINPYVTVYDADGQVLKTATAKGRRDAEWSGFKSTDKGVNQPRMFYDGSPLFCEIWDDGYLNDSFVGEFVVFPDYETATADSGDGRFAKCVARIQWDWKEAKQVTRPAYAVVTLRFHEDARKTGKADP